MLSYSASLSLYGTLTRDTSTANNTLFPTLYSDSIRAIATIRSGKWWWLEVLEEVDTVADQQAYQIPNNIRKLVDVYVEVGTTNPVIYSPIAIEDPDRWKQVLMSRLGTSDVPMFYYREGNVIRFAPTPATAGNTIFMRGRLNLKDLSIVDYTTGSVVSVASGGTAVVGTGTTWTASMAGRYIRIAESDTANKGDGYWYEIASVTDTTNLVLKKPYEGTAIVAGTAAYTIGQMSPIPEAYDIAPIYRASALYHQKVDNVTADRYWRLYDGGKEAGLIGEDAPYGGIIGRMMEENGEKVEGAWVSPLSNNLLYDPNIPPQLASGF